MPAAGRSKPALALSLSPAPQTLIVRRAPPELRLKQPLPVPAASSPALSPPLPSHSEQVRIDAVDVPKQASSGVPADALLLPAIDVTSLPERDLLAPAATAIPTVNQVAAGSPPESPAAQNGGSPQTGASHRDGESLKHAESPGDTAAPVNGASPKAGQSAAALPAAVNTPGAQTAAAAEDSPLKGLTRIEQPPNGRPPASVLGESVAGQYPETAPQMHGLVVSTIYLRVGLKKSWILEYWVPGGGTRGVEAPWPYLMFRPDLTLTADADAVMVRGALTAEGRFDRLLLLLPAEWAQKDSLYHALQQWKFRPASRDGSPLLVEVLLVIPRQPEN